MQDSFSYFVNQLIAGISLGAIYGLIAIGYTMVYGIVGMINFAHGEIFMIGAFVSLIVYFLLGALGVSWVPMAIFAMLVLAMVFTAMYGWSLERVAYRPLRRSPRLAPLITAIGMSIFLQNYVQLLQGARPRPLQPLIPGNFELWSVKTPGGTDYAVSVSYLQLFIILVTVALLVGFTWLITRTPLGRAQRACEQDQKMAGLLGINVDKTIALTFVMGAGLAAVAGMIYTLRYGSIDFFIGFLAGVKAFTAAVLGGIGSLPGAMIGGLLIGLIEVFFAGYINSEYKDVAVFTVLVVVLIFRPTGLLGKPDVEKV
jgi:branched-chain amino acid transport system permease protein